MVVFITKPTLSLATKMVFIYAPFNYSSYQNKILNKMPIKHAQPEALKQAYVILLITLNTSNSLVPPTSKVPYNWFSGTNYIHEYPNKLFTLNFKLMCLKF